ncbi:unnamed protein product [Zymoseptoria tritici ST99CH_1A5]|uniref:Uncharacterized protein n=1 Tax=Zymoseptoria tritici ST99CH_1A5 TaxID=1276529 RepID=A0A1Y6LIB3_ZYMTR|nr:unnamed protein product [Zymoseptoria tritici ST99CH_1A5]
MRERVAMHPSLGITQFQTDISQYDISNFLLLLPFHIISINPSESHDNPISNPIAPRSTTTTTTTTPTSITLSILIPPSPLFASHYSFFIPSSTPLNPIPLNPSQQPIHSQQPTPPPAESTSPPPFSKNSNPQLIRFYEISPT